MANVRITNLRPGDKIFMNDLPDSVEEFVGFSDDSSKYGKSPSKIFDTWADVKRHYKVSSLRDLENLQNQNEYGYHTYLITKDKNGKINSYYYIFEGKFSWGSGAAHARFTMVERQPYFKIKTGKYKGRITKGTITSEKNVQTSVGNFYFEPKTIVQI